MTDGHHQDDDADMLGTVSLVTKIFGHVLRMAAKHGVALDEANIEPLVKTILAEEDPWSFDGDLSEAITTMFELPEALGAYVDPLGFVMSNQVLTDIDLQRADSKVAARRSTIRLLRKPPSDKPER